MLPRPPTSTLFPYTTALPILGHAEVDDARNVLRVGLKCGVRALDGVGVGKRPVLHAFGRPVLHRRLACVPGTEDRKSTRLNSSHSQISYAVFCLKKKKNGKSW